MRYRKIQSFVGVSGSAAGIGFAIYEGFFRSWYAGLCLITVSMLCWLVTDLQRQKLTPEQSAELLRRFKAEFFGER